MKPSIVIDELAEKIHALGYTKEGSTVIATKLAADEKAGKLPSNWNLSYVETRFEELASEKEVAESMGINYDPDDLKAREDWKTFIKANWTDPVFLENGRILMEYSTAHWEQKNPVLVRKDAGAIVQSRGVFPKKFERKTFFQFRDSHVVVLTFNDEDYVQRAGVSLTRIVAEAYYVLPRGNYREPEYSYCIVSLKQYAASPSAHLKANELHEWVCEKIGKDLEKGEL